MLSGKATLKLKDAGAARTDEERLVCRLFRTEGPCTVSEIVQRIAQEMYNEELKHGGGVADIGVFGPRLFERDARALVECMRGRCLSVEGEASK